MLNLKTLLVVACAFEYGEEEAAALLRLLDLSLPIVVVVLESRRCGGVESRNFFCALSAYRDFEVCGHVLWKW